MQTSTTRRVWEAGWGAEIRRKPLAAFIFIPDRSLLVISVVMVVVFEPLEMLMPSLVTCS